VLVAIFTLLGCDRRDARSGSERTVPAGDTATRGYEYLRDEAEHLVSFLRGETRLRSDLLADSVTLYLAPEGGGERRRLAKRQLKNRAAWRVGAHTFVPPQGVTQLTTRAGYHFNCLAMPLQSKNAQLAHYPHIGARLAPANGTNCLQAWNATFVFNEDRARPRLTAVVLDQWEW
jgi:hypothetical protein